MSGHGWPQDQYNQCKERIHKAGATLLIQLFQQTVKAYNEL